MANARSPRPAHVDSRHYNHTRVKDKSIIWISAGGIALWIFVTYAPVRDPIVRSVKHILDYIAAQF